MKYLAILFSSLVLIIPNLIGQDFASPQMNAYSITQQGSRSSPVLVDIDNDGDLDLFTGLVSGDFGFYENIGSSTWISFGVFTIAPFNISSIGGDATPFFVDLDSDGDLDLLAGGDGGLRYYENNGNANIPAFGFEVQSPWSIISPSGISKPYLVDIDNDNDMDLFVGSSDGNTYYYQNNGTNANPVFAAYIQNPFGLPDVGTRSSPALADLDSDGDFDLLVGNKNGDMHYFENVGTQENPDFNFVGVNPFSIQNVLDDAKPCFGDLDGDGDVDLMVGNSHGDYYYFENISIASGIKQIDINKVTIYPNPVSEYLHIQFNDFVSEEWNLKILDMNGRVVFRESHMKNSKVYIGKNIGRGIFFAYLENRNKRIDLGKIVLD